MIMVILAIFVNIKPRNKTVNNSCFIRPYGVFISSESSNDFYNHFYIWNYFPRILLRDLDHFQGFNIVGAWINLICHMVGKLNWMYLVFVIVGLLRELCSTGEKSNKTLIFPMHGPLVVWPWHFKDNEDRNTKFKKQDF